MSYRRFFLQTGIFVAVLFAFFARAEAQIGQIKKMTGDVHVVRGNEKIPARVGTLLESKDTVVTGSRSNVGITFIDDSRFSLGPRSRVDLEKFQFDPTTQDGEFLTKVNRGTVLIDSGQIAKHSPNAMKVKTRTSILGVRGTRFVVKVR